MKRSRTQFGRIVLLCGLAGCSFDEDAASGVAMNACATDAECADDTRCQEGMCVARSVESPLAVVLEVVPSGVDAAPVLLDRFVVEGPMTRDWELPEVVEVSGTLRSAEGPIDGEVRFVRAGVPSGVPLAAVSASTVGAAAPGHYAVRLAVDVAYRMEVTPASAALPPLRREVTVTEATRLDVEYPANLETRTFEVRGAPEGETLHVRAFDRDTGALASSIAVVESGRATLVLSPEASALRLEVSVEESYQELATRAEPASCDRGGSSYPTVSIDEGDLAKDTIDLPGIPPRIRYEGSVDPCPEVDASAEEVGSLPITLRSTDLQFDDAETSFTSSFAATTTAEESAGQLLFCVELLPGTYEVVVTPPASMTCAIFAETRLVAAPDGETATGVLLSLPPPAYLTGTLRTTDRAPLGGATVEAQALGRSEGVQLAEDDPSVTQYNRSKQTTSDGGGDFELPVDLGGYDVVVKPPAESGYPWRVLHDVNVGARGVPFGNEIEIASPVRVDGVVRRSGSASNGALEGTEVRAYAIVEDEFDTERAVPVGKATTDADGAFVLLLSPSTRKGW
jgi:hypothetical protein